MCSHEKRWQHFKMCVLLTFQLKGQTPMNRVCWLKHLRILKMLKWRKKEIPRNDLIPCSEAPHKELFSQLSMIPNRISHIYVINRSALKWCQFAFTETDIIFLPCMLTFPMRHFENSTLKGLVLPAVLSARVPVGLNCLWPYFGCSFCVPVWSC